MGYKDILVILDPSSDTDPRLTLAIHLAATHGARLVGADVCSDAAFEGQSRERALLLQDRFEAATRAAGVIGDYRDVARSRRAGRHDYAHYADLVVASRSAPEARDQSLAGIPEDLLVQAGVPLLLLPSGWTSETVGARIVVAWNGSREATRAVHDALPLLTRAERVTIFAFAAAAEDFGEDARRLADHLARHAITAGISTWPATGEISPVEALFACLDTQDADLIVAGAYGHSRFIENLFGGVSRDLLRQPALPLLLSH